MSTVTVPPVERKPDLKELEATTLISRGVRTRPLFDPEILRRAIKRVVRKAQPKDGRQEPCDVCRGSRRGSHDCVCN